MTLHLAVNFRKGHQKAAELQCCRNSLCIAHSQSLKCKF